MQVNQNNHKTIELFHQLLWSTSSVLLSASTVALHYSSYMKFLSVQILIRENIRSSIYFKLAQIHSKLAFCHMNYRTLASFQLIKHGTTEVKQSMGLKKKASLKTYSTSPALLTDIHVLRRSSSLNSKLKRKVKTTKNNLKDQIC